MLVMTRRPGDQVAIGDGIVVKVLEIKGDRVRLGIDAPADVKVTAVEPAQGPETQRK
jgi:carbon storage regulator